MWFTAQASFRIPRRVPVGPICTFGLGCIAFIHLTSRPVDQTRSVVPGRRLSLSLHATPERDRSKKGHCRWNQCLCVLCLDHPRGDNPSFSKEPLALVCRPMGAVSVPLLGSALTCSAADKRKRLMRCYVERDASEWEEREKKKVPLANAGFGVFSPRRAPHKYSTSTCPLQSVGYLNFEGYYPAGHWRSPLEARWRPAGG